MKENDDILEKYIGHILSIEDKAEDFTSEELKSVAKELGISDDQLARLEKKVELQIERGVGFIDHECWDEAISELDEAYSFSPLNAKIIYLLALSYKGRYFFNNENIDREKAENFAKKCIKLDSGYSDAYKILNSLNKRETSKKPLPVTTLIAVVICVALSIAIYLSLSKTTKTTVSNNIESSKKTKPTQPLRPLQPVIPEKKSAKSATGLFKKTNLYINCINRQTGRAIQSYNRYLSWADPNAGPIGSRRVLGLYTIYSIDGCMGKLEQASQMRLENQEMTSAGDEYKTALAALYPALTKADEYYNNEDYKDDNMRQGQEMHAPLLNAFKKYIKADLKLRKHIEEYRKKNNQIEYSKLFEDEKISIAPIFNGILNISYSIAISTNTEDIIQIDKPSLGAISADFDKLRNKLNEYLSSHNEASKEWVGLTKAINTFSKNAKGLFRRVRDKKTYSFSEKRTASWLVKGSHWVVIKSYNELADKYNRDLVTKNRLINYPMYLKIPPEIKFPL